MEKRKIINTAKNILNKSKIVSGNAVEKLGTLLGKVIKLQSLKAKFVSFNFITIMIIVIMSIIFSIYQFNKSATNNLHETLKSQVMAAEIMLNNKISYLDGINDSIVKDNSVVVPLRLEIDTQLVDYFSGIGSRFKEINDVVVINDKGVLYKSTDKYMDIVEKLKVDAQKDSKSVSGLVYTDKLSIISAKPVYGGRTYEDKKLIGVILIAHNLSSDFDFIGSMGKNLESNIALYQNSKMIAMSDGKGKISKPTKNEESIKANDVFKKGSYFSTGNVDMFNDEYFVYYKTINDINKKAVGVLAAAQSSSILQKDIITIVISLVIIGSIGLTLGLVSTWIISSVLTKPITSLTKCVQVAQTGDLTVEVQCSTNDEIKILSEGFNEMIRNLRNVVKMIAEKSNVISNINSNLNESYTKINSHIIDIDKSVAVLNNNFIENSLSIGNVNSGVEEMAVRSQHIVEYSNDTQVKSKHIVNEASKVMTKVEDAKNNSKEVVDETYVLVKLIGDLENISKKIENIVSVITGIANQTTLLSFNAAIEAARAGEYGNGFSVVAKEISSLSSSTKKQAETIIALNNDIISQVRNVTSKMMNNLHKVETSSETVKELGSVLDNLTNFIQGLDKNMDDFVVSAESQAACSEQITGSMDTIASNSKDMTGKVSEITNAVANEKTLVENTLGYVNGLQQSFDELKKLVDNFKV